MSDLTEDNQEILSGILIKNRYLIQNILGSGRLGHTYLALDSHRFNEPCVLKEFAPRDTERYHIQKSRELFKREAAILYHLQHPQIPKFLACFEERERLFLVQEYVDGITYSALLKERQQRGETFLEAEVMEWLIHLLPVLDYVHQCGIIHRDISPDNIMQPHGEILPVLIDFGVGKQWIVTDKDQSEDSRHLDEENQKSLIGKMSFVGKIGYAPHEQINMGISFPSSDLYALGVTAIVLLTGKEPTQLMDQYSLEWQWQQYTNVSESLAQILEKMLQHKPIERYQSAQELFTDIQKLQQVDDVSIIDRSGLPSLQPQPFVETSQQQKYGQTQETRIIQSYNESNPELNQQATLAIEPKLIERCQQELAYCIGPMASIIIKETLAQSSCLSSQEFIEALAKAIPNPQLGQKFKQRLLM